MAMQTAPANTHRTTTLTVIVVDAKNKPASGAHVSITPSDASLVTNASGEVVFTLGNATKYNITATAGGKTVTVPYYITANGATRLVVNPVYVKTIERQQHAITLNFSTIMTGVGIIVGVVLLYILIRRFLRGKRRQRRVKSTQAE